MNTIVLLPNGNLVTANMLSNEYLEDCFSGKLFLNSKYKK